MEWILSYILFLPMLGALVVWLVPRGQATTIRVVSLLTLVLDLVLGIVLFLNFNAGTWEMQFVKPNWEWFAIGGVTVHYNLGVDGISLLLVELTLLLGPVAILSSWSAVSERIKEYHLFMLLLQTGMLGAFLALDLVLFYVFYPQREE